MTKLELENIEHGIQSRQFDSTSRQLQLVYFNTKAYMQHAYMNASFAISPQPVQSFQSLSHMSHSKAEFRNSGTFTAGTFTFQFSSSSRQLSSGVAEYVMRQQGQGSIHIE